MATNLDINKKLLGEACKITALKTKTAVLNRIIPIYTIDKDFQLF